MKVRIKTTFKQSSDAELSKLAHRISESLKSNPNFPDPVPSQADLERVVREYQLAISVAGRKDRTLISAKNDKKAELQAMLSQLAVYIESASQGDRTRLLSSGFDITRDKNEPLALAPISQLIVDIGPPGQATTRVKKVNGARSYVHQYTPDPITSDSVWVSETHTERQHTFSNLKSVNKYWFRVIAVGRGKQNVYSPAVSSVIQ